MTADEATVERAFEQSRVVPGRLTWHGRRYLRWMLGPEAVVRQVEHCLSLLGAESGG